MGILQKFKNFYWDIDIVITYYYEYYILQFAWYFSVLKDILN